MLYVIPHYGSKLLLKKTVKAIIATDKKADIYIGDDSHSLKQGEFKECKIVKGPKKGFAANINNVMRTIKRGLVVIINNDMELDEGWKMNISKVLPKRSKNFTLASKIINQNGLIDSAGDCYSWFGQGYNRLHLKPKSWKVNNNEKIIGPTGGLMVTTAETFHMLNGFDEQFESYVEDTDFNIRARNIGVKVLFCEKALAIHKGSATYSSDSKQYYSARNTILNIRKNFTGTLKSRLMFRNFYYWRLKRAIKPQWSKAIKKGIQEGLQMNIDRINDGAKIESLNEISTDNFLKSFWRLLNL